MSARILIAEDSPTQAEALHALLTEHGYTVAVARSGEDALRLLQGEDFDLVVSDVIMGGITGYDLTRAIKNRPPDRRPNVILLTSLEDPRDAIRGLEAGADSYLRKPYKPGTLITRIRGMLDGTAVRPVGAQALEVNFLGESFTIGAGKAQILGVMLSSFEDLVRVNNALEDSKGALAAALKREHEARARAEEDARQMELLAHKAEAASRARDDVVATVSHDLRNPLSTIYTSTAMLLEMDLPDEIRRRQIAIIQRTANRMMHLLQDLLDVSKIEAGGFAVLPAPEQIAMLLAEAHELVDPLAAEKGIHVVEDVSAGSEIVLIDRGRILQVLSNLTGNALKFTPAGGTISLRAYRQDHEVVIEVSDTGRGISPENLPHVFDRYFQAGRSSRDGAGLGLAIVHGIMDAHGGRVWVSSILGQGSTFSIALPLASRAG